MVMKRKTFLKNLALSIPVIGAVGSTSQLFAKKKSSINTTEKVGFEHLPKKETREMKTILHKADSRGHANHGWLNTHHSFSFANYYNPDRMHFGVLRVLNDDYIAPGRGFPRHPHNNMEIITIPFEGDLEHKDSMGNSSVIKEGDIQVMSAGTGIQHSEFNHNSNKAVKLFQIWLFPREQGVTPRYDQLSISSLEKKNELYQVLSPNSGDDGVWIHQNAWFHLGKFDKTVKQTYQLNQPNTNGVYIIAIEGSIAVNGEKLAKRDALGVWDTDQIIVEALEEKTHFLIMEVPMELPKM